MCEPQLQPFLLWPFFEMGSCFLPGLALMKTHLLMLPAWDDRHDLYGQLLVEIGSHEVFA
jgi:hypothetical protein